MNASPRPMTVSERLSMRLEGSPEPDSDTGYTMYPNWQLRMEIADAAADERKLATMEAWFRLCGNHYYLCPASHHIGLPCDCGFGPILEKYPSDTDAEAFLAAQKEPAP